MKTERQKAKDTAWRWFSKYIRLRDCLATTNDPNYGACISCGKIYEFKQLQAGHLVPGRKEAVLFDEHGVNAQCVHCNKYLSGNTTEYRERLILKIGEAMVKDVEDRRLDMVKRTVQDYRVIANHYRELFNSLLKEEWYEAE